MDIACTMHLVTYWQMALEKLKYEVHTKLPLVYKNIISVFIMKFSLLLIEYAN